MKRLQGKKHKFNSKRNIIMNALSEQWPRQQQQREQQQQQREQLCLIIKS